jgi:hypothetical protein
MRVYVIHFGWINKSEQFNQSVKKKWLSKTKVERSCPRLNSIHFGLIILDESWKANNVGKETCHCKFLRGDQQVHLPL